MLYSYTRGNETIRVESREAMLLITEPKVMIPGSYTVLVLEAAVVTPTGRSGSWNTKGQKRVTRSSKLHHESWR